MTKKSEENIDAINMNLNQQSIKLNKYQVFIALISLFSTLFIIANQYQQSKEIVGIKQIIDDTSKLRNALKKPLEGVWSFRTEYNKFHNKEGIWESSGKAIFTWNPDRSKYEIFMATSIIERGKTNTSLVTLFGNGYIDANREGLPIRINNNDIFQNLQKAIIDNIPKDKKQSNKSDTKNITTVNQDGFNIHFEYNGRTGIEGYDTPSFRKFDYKNCKLVRANNDEIVKIITTFKSFKSEGTVEFKKES